MSTYIIGDIHGCYRELQSLLELINYNPLQDRLGFVGDLVNRGPDSLAVLRFVKNVQHAYVVLGNHDLYLLGLGYGVITTTASHTFHDIFSAPDKMELLDWLRHCPLVIQNHFGTIVHAGIPPQWSVIDAVNYAQEVTTVLQQSGFEIFLNELVGDEPRSWHAELTGMSRWRYIVNALTRLRFCSQTGDLDLSNKTSVTAHHTHYKPWFDWYTDASPIFFGHWASLKGQCTRPRMHALDVGCVYGEGLKAVCVETGALFLVVSQNL